jgi:hypothetical protein
VWRAVLMRLFCLIDTIRPVFADGGYTSTLIDWAGQMFGGMERPCDVDQDVREAGIHAPVA